ncbi:hypothetical protein RB195_012424 [Necator americanus]
MAETNIGDQLGAQLMKAAQIMEDHIDNEMNRLDNMDEDELEIIRRRRMEEMKKLQKAKTEMLSNGHGKYEEVADEKEFFEATKKSKNVICLFYLDGNMRCKIVDKHLKILAPKHLATRFIHVNAEKVHFLVTRLNIRVIPTIAIIKDQQTIDYIRGFDDLGGVDDFKTEVLEKRLARSGVIKVEKPKVEQPKKKIIRTLRIPHDPVMASRRGTIDDTLSSWIVIGDVKLKFVKNYTDLPSLRIKNAIHFAASTYSGPLALAFSNSATSWFIDIRMSGGEYLKRKLEVPDVCALEWTKGHRLVVMDRRGNASLYSSLGERVSEFHFGNGIREVREVRVFPTTHDSGIAIIDDQMRIFVVNSVSEPVVWSMHSSIREHPSAWTVLQPRSQLTQVVVALGTTFYTGCQGEQLCPLDTPFSESEGQYARIVVSWDHSMIALYHSSSLIQIVAADLSKQISRIQVPGEQSIYRFGWVGLEALFLQRTPLSVQFFNVYDETAHYDLRTEFVQIGVESDGVKLYSDTGMEFVSPVSGDERAVLGVASASDGALLYEAAQWLNTDKSHQSYEYTMQIRDLSLAIDQCISTATSAWSPDMQKALLKAAHFGVAFSTGFDSARFVRVLRELRVLNEVRRKRIGMPITCSQLHELGESCLINRLIDIGAYGTAVEICKWLRRDEQEGIDRVLLEWVRRTITEAASLPNKSELNMEALDEKIARKLLGYPHVSLADAAKRAIEAKLPKLARLLIKREKDDSKQVNVLLQLGDVQEALARAAAAQRPQLMHQVVRHLMKEQKRADYELAIRKIPLAQCLYQDLVREESDRGSGKMMLALLEQASDFERQIMFHLDAAESEMNPNERLNCLRRAKEAAKNLGDKGIEELLSDMAAFVPGQLERGEDRMTIRDTVIEHAADSQKVAQLKHQAKLTDKQVWLWTIEGLAKKGKMEQLFDMAQKKSPVGYVPFLKACMKYNRQDECKKYFAKVHGYQELVAAYLAMGNFVGAAKMAFDRRDHDTLQHILMKSHGNKDAHVKVAQLIKSL